MYIFAVKSYFYTFMAKNNRHKTIEEIIRTNDINSQEELLNILMDKGFEITQATLSRDIKELKIAKIPTANGLYAYKLPERVLQNNTPTDTVAISPFSFISIGFSGQLAVVKTRPGYAMGLAGEIDEKAKNTVLGTVAGDDTILIIPIEGVSRETLVNSLSDFISPELKETIKRFIVR